MLLSAPYQLMVHPSLLCILAAKGSRLPLLQRLPLSPQVLRSYLATLHTVWGRGAGHRQWVTVMAGIEVVP